MPDILQSLHAARMIGLANALRAVRYAWRRDRSNASSAKPVKEAAPRPPGRLLKVESDPSGALFRFENTQLTVRFLTPDFLFIGHAGAQMHPSYAVVQSDWPPAAVTCEQLADGWRLYSSAVEVRLGNDGGLRFFNRAGKLIRQEEPLQTSGAGWLQRVPLSPDACIYGLGERAARLDLRPGAYRLWNTEAGGTYGPGTDPLYINMPVYLCLDQNGSYLVFYDNTYAGAVSLAEQAEVRFDGGPARYYLAFGAPPELLERLTALTGRPPLPPRWALGYQQSKWGYRSEANMRQIWQQFKEHDLPLSVLYLDADHMKGYRTLSLDTSRYPTLANFAAELEGYDVHLVASVNPAIKQEPGFDLYDQALAEGAFCKTPAGQLMIGLVWPGWTAYTDFTNPRIRAWWGQQYARLLQHGIAGFWHDMNEPSSFAAWGEMTLPLNTRHDLDGRGGDHREAHNVYGLLMNQAGYEGLRSLQPEKRPFILSRSGWVGMQRYGWTWTGDVETSWAALRQTLACVLGLGLCGLPYAGPDIGGFSGAPTPELFVRWFQLAAFLPFFRTHCAFYLPPREPWQFGPEILKFTRQLLLLRYRLLPYWYTLAQQASQTGAPIVRPLFWAEPDNQALWQVDDTFMLGEALLVAPALAEGARQRTVILPRGGWYEFSSGRYFNGGATVEIQAPLAQIPLLVRAGSLLPLAEGAFSEGAFSEGPTPGGSRQTGEPPSGAPLALALHVYRPLKGETGAGWLYSDAGDGYGPSRQDRFTLSPLTEGGFALEWSNEGSFPWPYASVELHLHGFEVARLYAGEQVLPVEEGVCRVERFERVVIPG